MKNQNDIFGECKNILVQGSQWGDEAKAKIISSILEELITERDIKINVIRYQGGANAGHTLIVNGKKTIVHLLPSGVAFPYENISNIIGKGVAFDPEIFFQEIKECSRRAKVYVDLGCPVVLPLHKLIDEGRENVAIDTKKIGTTKRGIGPCYEDFVSRSSIRVSDIINYDDSFKEKFRNYYDEKRALLVHLGMKELVGPFDDFLKWCCLFGEKLKPFVADTTTIVRANEQNSINLFEGAQGSGLDLYHGTFPFVTSSSCSRASIINSFGFIDIDLVIGVAKAYTTRVGNGPFPTWLNDKTGERLQKKGNEFGATTGRPRDCGWFDAVAVLNSCDRGGVTKLVLPKLDVLSGFSKIKVCVNYGIEGLGRNATLTTEVMKKAKPEYIIRPGWKEDITNCKNFGELPTNAKKLVSLIGALTKRDIIGVGVGPRSTQTIWIKKYI